DVGDDAREVDLAGGRERDETGQLRGDIGRAVVAAAQRLLAQEVERPQRHLDAGRGDADDRRLAGRTQDVPGKPDRVRPADHLERVVEPAGRELPDGR